MGSWSTFPAVDFETDAFLQETPEDAQVLSNRVKNVGNAAIISATMRTSGSGRIASWVPPWCTRGLAPRRHPCGLAMQGQQAWSVHQYMRGVPGLDVGMWLALLSIYRAALQQWFSARNL